MPPLTSAAEAVALLTVRSGEPDEETLRMVLEAITRDVPAWGSILWLADVALALLTDVTDDVPEALRTIALAVA